MARENWQAYFERVYETSNPWSIDNSYADKVRAEIIRNIFDGLQFNTGIDVCCGEGVFTNRLQFVEKMTGVDISRKAIGRAQRDFPHIDFVVDDFSKFEKVHGPYSFVSCFEALYYPDSDEEREKALNNIRRLGDSNSYYAFSVVTIGENTSRRYFTRASFEDLLQKYFTVEHVTPFVLRGRPTIISKLVFSFLMSINERFGVKLASKKTMRASETNVYQHLFIARKK